MCYLKYFLMLLCCKMFDVCDFSGTIYNVVKMYNVCDILEPFKVLC